METAVKFILIGCLIQDVLGDFNISLPARIEALKGSCVFIPCTFDIDRNVKDYLTNSVTRKWFKRGHFDNEVFPSSGKLKGEIFGKPTDKNCTTRFDDVRQSDSGEYYFRIESQNLKYSYKKDSTSSHTEVIINVSASPSKPTVQLYDDQMEVKVHQKVMEDSSVILRCSANIYCPYNPPSLTWSSSPNTLILNEQKRQDQTKLISDLNFNITHLHHGVTFTCTIKYQLKKQIRTEKASLTLRVQYAPKNTSVTVNPSGSVLEGHSVNLTCSSDGNPPVLNYNWYRDTKEHLKHLQTGDTLTIMMTNSTHSGRYYCTAQNKHGKQNSSVLLDIQYAPKNTSVTVNPSGSVLEGRSVTLTCSSDGNPPVFNYNWYRDTEEQLEQSGQNLTINKTNLTHSGQYYCTARNQYGTQNSSVLLDIQYAPKISSSSSCSHSDVIVCVCEVRGNPSPTLQWHLSRHPVINSTGTAISEERVKNTSLRNVLTIRQSLKDTPSLQCVSTNVHGTASQKFQMLLTPHHKPGFHHSSLLVGVAIGASVVVMFWIMTHFYKRRQNCKPIETRQDNNTGFILTQRVVVQDEEEEELVFSNKAMMPHGGGFTQESLHYSLIDFTNAEPASGEIIGLSSLTTEYTVIQHHTAGAPEAENDI
ncbi:B-cell receptor CD22-like isoform X1 [Myxocyprinus asiaticus]|uniref:B-cell receptor CD22-like isoform X1 n=1 Tax=Myxocyprinus asiaticus TaxID=70543 RepID=UPI002222402B|nr:B-cell receptor CD22-like isoform X1 [Myxocyprinus asiaticus]